MNSLERRLVRCPVIAAVRSESELTRALESSAEVLFLLGGDISTIGQVIDRVKSEGRLGFLHLDLMEGLGKDESAVRYLARVLGADGIVSTRANLIKRAKAEGMQAVQRIFLLDSASIETGTRMFHQSDCDAVEVMPGLVFPELVHRLVPALSVPIIAGGLVTEQSQVNRILQAGAIGVSTGHHTLWGRGRHP